ncbi:MAG: hypothetical protein FWF57_10155 [Defluviitaleaceae bacterium]|nr:hypothetical protein [Defluviitaleaceae bacterium]
MDNDTRDNRNVENQNQTTEENEAEGLEITSFFKCFLYFSITSNCYYHYIISLFCYTSEFFSFSKCWNNIF